MRQRTLLLTAALACSAVIGWFVLDLGDTPARPIEGLEAPRDVAAPLGRNELIRPETLAGPALRAPERVVAAEAPIAAATRHPWEGQLAGVTGRLLEHDGAPAAGLAVELLQIDTTLILPPESTPLRNPSFQVGAGRTDAEGRFHLGGAFREGFHALGIDRGGPRSALRVVERALELGDVVDLGDITLAAFGTLIGSVIDEDGEPVAGARVRFAAVPDFVAETGVFDLRADSLVYVAEGPVAMHFEVPALVAELLDTLPIPTTHTAADGTFRLEGVPLARIVGGVDHPGFVATIVPALEMEGGEHDLGELELTVGRTLRGRVVDRAGQPIAGAEVQAGALLTIAPVGVLRPATPTDAAGRFTVTGVPEMGKVVGFARRSASDSWVEAKPSPDPELLEFQLASAGPVQVLVVGFDNEPVSGAKLAFHAVAENLNSEINMFLQTAATREVKRPHVVREVEPGTYVADGLSHGAWEVEVESAIHPPTRHRFEHHGANTAVHVQCDPGERLAVTVRDTEGQPIEHAHAAVLASQLALIDALATDWTDADGAAELGPFVLLAKGEGDGPGRAGARMAPLLRVVHPKYSDALIPLTAGQGSLAVTLTVPCEIVGRVHWAGAVPDHSYMLLLERRGQSELMEAFSMPRVNLSLPDGSFRFRGLAPGRYKLTLAERYLDQDPIAMIVAEAQPQVRFAQEYEVTAVAPLSVDIDLTPNGLGPTTRVLGSVRVNGSPLQGAKVSLRGSEKREMQTDANGLYAFEDVSAHGHVNVRIDGDVTLPDGTRSRRRLGENWEQLEAGKEVRLDVDLEFEAIKVLVVDASTQLAIAGAKVSVGRAEVSAETGADGRATLSVDRKERFSIDVNADRYAPVQVPVNSKDEPKKEHRVELVRGVICSGHVRFPVQDAGRQWCYLQCTPLSGQTSGPVHHGQPFGTGLNAADEYAFEFTAVAPGRYMANIYTNGNQGEPVEFEVGANGTVGLDFEYRPKP